MGFEGMDWKYDENNELVSLLLEGIVLEDKYLVCFEGLYFLGDDFSVVNFVIKKDYCDRVVKLFEEKVKFGIEG